MVVSSRDSVRPVEVPPRLVANAASSARSAVRSFHPVVHELRYTVFNRIIIIFSVLCAFLYGSWLLITTRSWSVPLQVTGLIYTAASFLAIYLAATIVVRVSAKKFIQFVVNSEDVEYRLILTKMYVVGMYVVATTIVLWKIGLSAANLTIFLGFATTGLAFAVRDILTSYFVWFMLLTKRPFRIGDYIRVGDSEGRVQHIGTFYVIIDETPDTKEDHVRVPNKVFLEKPITNFGRDLVTSTIALPIEPVPDDFSARYRLFSEQIHDVAPNAFVALDTRAEKIVATVNVRTIQVERSVVRDAIIESFVRSFKVPLAKNTVRKKRRPTRRSRS
jgi:small-conductance mechanosensitive channel